MALPEHAEAYGRNRSVLHSVFQNSTYLGRIMPAAKIKEKIMALLKIEVVCIAERLIKSETVAQRLFGSVFTGLKLCFSPV